MYLIKKSPLIIIAIVVIFLLHHHRHHLHYSSLSFPRSQHHYYHHHHHHHYHHLILVHPFLPPYHPRCHHLQILILISNALQVDSRFEIPLLEEVLITVRSPLNAEQKPSTLESLVKHSPRLRKMIIRISQMKNCNEMADDFFEDICKLRSINTRKIHIE